jgi:hypothetical protein
LKTEKIHSELACLIASLSWKDDKPMGFNVHIGHKIEIKGKPTEVTEDTYLEILEIQSSTKKCFNITKTGKHLNLMGTKIAE